jgi:hypothetical protein
MIKIKTTAPMIKTPADTAIAPSFQPSPLLCISFAIVDELHGCNV